MFTLFSGSKGIGDSNLTPYQKETKIKMYVYLNIALKPTVS